MVKAQTVYLPAKGWHLLQKLQLHGLRTRPILSGLVLLATTVLFLPPGRSQILPDGSLPNNSSIVPEANTLRIEGGTAIGDNLFHSFSEFSLPTGSEAFFNNSLNIQNIFTRVTGSNPSLIDGILRANGTANLFLLNPNGVVFGSNAQLNIGGSFFATSADAVVFDDGNRFSATDPEAPPLLTMNVPVGLQYGPAPGTLVNQSQVSDSQGATTGLQVAPGETLALLGGNVIFQGGHLQSPDGRIEIGSVGGNSSVSLTPTQSGFAVGYEGVENFQDIGVLQQSTLNTSGEGSGAIHLQGRRVAVREGSRVSAIAPGSQPGGNIRIQASQGVEVSGADPENFTAIATDTRGAGDAGDLTIETGRFLLQGTAFLSTSSFGSGNGGNLTLRARDSITAIGVGMEFLDRAFRAGFSGELQPNTRLGGLFSETLGFAPAGDLTLETAGDVRLYNGAIAFNGTFGAANSGKITIRAGNAVEAIASGVFNLNSLGSSGLGGQLTINTNRLTIRDGSVMANVTLGSGAAGDLFVNAADSIEISRTLPQNLLPTGLYNNTLFGSGAAGDIEIQTGRLVMREGTLLGSNSGSAIDGEVIPAFGAGGNINIQATDSVEILGVSPDGRVTSGPGTSTFGSTPAGELTISTGKLILGDGAIISSATFGSGNAGTLTVNASESVEVYGTAPLTGLPTTINSSSGRADYPQLRPTGPGGDVRVRTPELIVRDGASLDVRSGGIGAAGVLEIDADRLRLESGGSLSAATVAGTGGNIQVRSRDIRLQENSNINTDAGNTDGGNITISTETLTAFENSDITANALEGRGGRVSISAEGIFGIEFRETQTANSDITATSQLGSEFSGIVELKTPEVDPAAGLVDLADTVSDPSDRIVQGCTPSDRNQFIVTGRGGLPNNPTQPFSRTLLWQDLRPVTGTSETPTSEKPPSSPVSAAPTPLVEAQTWKMNRFGQIELVPIAPHPVANLHPIPKCPQ